MYHFLPIIFLPKPLPTALHLITPPATHSAIYLSACYGYTTKSCHKVRHYAKVHKHIGQTCQCICKHSVKALQCQCLRQEEGGLTTQREENLSANQGSDTASMMSGGNEQAATAEENHILREKLAAAQGEHSVFIVTESVLW